MTFDQFLISVSISYDAESGQRYGQWAFNQLSEIRPDLCDRIVAESLNGPERVDPFNNDGNLEAFWAYVEKHW